MVKIGEKVKDLLVALPVMTVVSVSFISLFGGTFWAISKGLNEIQENNSEKHISRQVGQDIGDIKQVKVVEKESGCNILLLCKQKKTDKEIVVEYTLSELEYVAMINKGMLDNEYVYQYVVPNKKPTFCGDKQAYKKYLSEKEEIEQENY